MLTLKKLFSWMVCCRVSAAKGKSPRRGHRTHPPVCPACKGFGRLEAHVIVCSCAACLAKGGPSLYKGNGATGICSVCKGAGSVPAKYAAIADPAARAGAIGQYVASARFN